jgi:YD repeat-containing protein
VTALVTALLFAEAAVRELVYPGAVTLGGQTVPRYDKGYLLYLDRTKTLEVFRPDGQLAYRLTVSCPPAATTCSTLTAAADSRGTVAVTVGYLKSGGGGGGIQLFSPDGKPGRFIDTDRLVPGMICFDREGNLWTLGWQRDSLRYDTEDQNDHPMVRKFSLDGKELGRFLPRSLWTGPKSSPGAGSGGYWRMEAAADRIGAVIHESFADDNPEWVEWDLNGNLISRTVLPDLGGMGRAYTSDGKLYAQFLSTDRRRPVLRRLDRTTGQWSPVATNLPEGVELPFLLGADGKDLVFRVGPGNVRLLYARPE